jgi:exodeoxyribonuclease VII small subunit
MSERDELDRDSFNSNYEVLRETAAWLSNQNEPDIDRLVPKVERAMQAYAICKDRLSKVEAALGKYLDQKDGDDEAAPASRTQRGRRSPFSSDGDREAAGDSPF